jgi:heavy metal sensor kinase
MAFSFEKIKKDGQYLETIQSPAGEPLRVFAKTVKVGKIFPKTFHIQTGESLNKTEAFLADLRTKMWIFTPFIILLGGTGAFWIARFSLKPLKAFSKEVSEISATNLKQRLEHQNISQELQELAKSFNATLDRLEEVFTQQKHFISNASHELRTPVTVIKSHCEIPLRRPRTQEEYKEALETIFKNIKNLEDLINKLLTLSRYDQKPFPIQKKKTDIENLLNTIGLMLKPIAEKKGIKMLLPQYSKAVYIDGEKATIGELFTNLIDNAIKYTGRGETVKTNVLENEDRVTIEVIDTGIGIPNPELKNIFERFYRIDPARGKETLDDFSNGHGFGLGLSIAKEIIENHGGKIEVESQFGVGTTFRVSLKKWKD